MVEQRLLTDVNLILLQNRRHRNDDRELLRIALEVVGHRQHRAVLVTNEDDLRRLVVKLGISLGDVEAAESQDSGP